MIDDAVDRVLDLYPTILWACRARGEDGVSDHQAELLREIEEREGPTLSELAEAMEIFREAGFDRAGRH